MPIIGPPSDHSYPEPEKSEKSGGRHSNRWYELYLDVPNWICPDCKATNFGRNAYCGGCFGRHGIKRPRPPGTGVEASPNYKKESDA